MEFYFARQPVFNRRKEVCGYKLELCPGLRNHYYDMYREPEDAEKLYRRLCYAGSGESPDRPAAVLDYTYDLLESPVPLLPREYVAVRYDKTDNSEKTVLREIRNIKSQGYHVLYDSSGEIHPAILRFIDFIQFDITSMSLESQFEFIKENKGDIKFFARGVDTWDDYKKALVAGYDYFQGDFYLKLLIGRPGALKPPDASLLRLINELRQPQPRLKEITEIIEHDLSLSYNLLKLVNAAFAAPEFKIKTISQAAALLGPNELKTFMSKILTKQLQSPETNELLRLSLIRGKFMELLADSREIPQKGSEAFFAGAFSLLDVIINRSMAEILDELPLTDAVKDGLLGREGALKALLDMVRLYERADWEKFDAVYNPGIAEQEEIMGFCLEALNWAESIDY